MAKSLDGGVTWTPLATIDMHTYQHPYNTRQVGEVRDVAQDGMIIKFHPIHAQLARDVGYQCPIMNQKCDGTCTYDPQRDLNGCFNWDGARIYIHEMTINGQNQDFTSLDDLRASGWDFQCRVSQCNSPPVTLVNAQAPGAVNSKMLRIDGSNFHWTYTFPGNGDPCTDVVCPTVVCPDGSNPPIAAGQCCGDLNLCPASPEQRDFSIKFGGQAWAMAKSLDGGVTWTPLATIDMHTYQHPYNTRQVGEVRDVAQDGMIIKFHPIHAQLARDVGYQCPIMNQKCDGTCTYDPQRDLNGCFNWDGARIYIHEMTINGQNQDFTSLDDLRASGWDFQCRVSQCNSPPVTLVNAQAPGAVNSKMLRIDGSNFYWTYTFPGNGGRRALHSHQGQTNGPGGLRRSLPSPQGDMNAPTGLRRLLAEWNN